MDWEKAAAAIRGANGTDSGNIYQNYANAGVINAAPEQFVGRQKAVQANVEEKQRQEGIQAAAQKKKLDDDREAAKTDPSKAYMKLGEDGNYRYYNGDGDQMNINQFSLLTGKRPDEILADSENPKDQKFVSDYQTMKQFANAWVNGDNDTLKKFREADPERYNQLISTYKSPSEMVGAFRNYYQDYYGNGVNSNQNTDRFSMSSKAAVGGDAQGKKIAAGIGGSDLTSTLTPIQMNAPSAPTFLDKVGDTAGTYGPLALVGGGSLWGKSSQQKAWEDYQEKLKTNPWMQYNGYLKGL